jgi:uncharacterized DUF497 family protein
MIEWDEAKRQRNLARHNIDLIDGEVLFDGRPIVTVSSPRGEELRFVTTGLIGSKFYTLVWTARGPATRLISLRRARDAEERLHRARHERGNPGDDRAGREPVQLGGGAGDEPGRG